jgi:SAM-dependent methyltransferase
MAPHTHRTRRMPPLRSASATREERAGRPTAGGTDYACLSGPAYHGAFVPAYDKLRPRPPDDLFSLLLSLAPSHPPGLVVDLGSGTGISTAPWSGRARHALGLEINPDMIHATVPMPGVASLRASALRTPLPDACADIVTCAQSFHWLDAGPATAEIARILRPSGVFAAYDYDWPPLADWEVDAAFLRVIEASGVDPSRPEKARHSENLKSCGNFRAVRQVFLHTRQVASGPHVARLPLAFGPVARRLREGATEHDLGLDHLRQTVALRLDPDANTLWWSYRVHIAVR